MRSHNISTGLHIGRTSNKMGAEVAEDHAEYGFVAVMVIHIYLTLFNALLLYIGLANRTKSWAKKANRVFYLILTDFITGFMGVMFIPVVLATKLDIIQNQYGFCIWYTFAFISCQTATYYHMLAVCIHRYRIARSVYVSTIDEGYKHGLESFCIWMAVMAAASFPVYATWERKHYFTSCRVDSVFEYLESPVLLYVLVLYCLPVILTNIIYVAMLCRMKSDMANIQSNNHAIRFENNTALIAAKSPVAPVPFILNQPTNGLCLKGHRDKATRVIGYILIVLNISIVSPVTAFSMILAGHTSVPPAIQVLTYFNNISSPFIYSLTIDPFREELEVLFHRLRAAIICKMKM